MRNRIECKLCNTIIESLHVHDFKWCECGAVAVDGGQEYFKRAGELYNILELPGDEENGK